MRIDSGPSNNKRTIIVDLPAQQRFGVMLSGGADSAVLLYILVLLNREKDHWHEIVPFTVARSDGAADYVNNIVHWINQRLDTDIALPLVVGTPNLHHSKQTQSGEQEAREQHGIRHVYYGSQQHPEEPMPGEYPNRPDRIHFYNRTGETVTTCPFAHVDKRHTLDLYNIFDCHELLAITHSCTEQTVGRCNSCYNCKEREWGLRSLGVDDPGTM